ncbi:hypothetical protein OOT46_20160 [Aquabacterium sp. A7-Y]|uniref:hypothetical protein n=1 Tax=Aquabacterium sp. A7-Y TaxID=1349605 RepID=UPI00223D07D2|nr:hypothetical protein [Aquabacterium sp. A7-Y]MCW7540151.1 hypothetical protein [Aquabacterium sp. A7-Y]
MTEKQEKISAEQHDGGGFKVYARFSIGFLVVAVLLACVLVPGSVVGADAGVGISPLLVPTLLGLLFAVLNFIVYAGMASYRSGGGGGAAFTLGLLFGGLALCWWVLSAEDREREAWIRHREAVEQAIRTHDFKQVRRAIDRCDEHCDDDYLSLVYGMAAVRGRVDVLKYLQARAEQHLSPFEGLDYAPSGEGDYRYCSTGEGGVSTLTAMDAALFGPVPEVRQLVLNAATQDELDAALPSAVRADDRQLLELLVKRGARPAAWVNDATHMSEYERRSSPYLRESLLDVAIRARAPNALAWLVDHGLPPLGHAAKDTEFRWTTLHQWARTAAVSELSEGQIDAYLSMLDTLVTDKTRHTAGLTSSLECEECGPVDIALRFDTPLTVKALMDKGLPPPSTDRRERLADALAKANDRQWIAARKARLQEEEKRRGSYGKGLPCLNQALRDMVYRPKAH